MNRDQQLIERSGSKCELCGGRESLAAQVVAPRSGEAAEECVHACQVCRQQIEGAELEPERWRCLNDSMWSDTAAVQVVAWRVLKRLQSEVWAQDLFDMLYLDEEALAWAEDPSAVIADGGEVGEVDGQSQQHVDSNGMALEAGDTVTLIKDLDVKGANFTAKRGTSVRGIRLVDDNPEHIEGRVSGQHIVILTKFVKKQS